MKKLMVITVCLMTVMSCKFSNEVKKEEIPVGLKIKDTAGMVVSGATLVVNKAKTEIIKRRYDPRILPHLVNMNMLLKSGTINFYDWKDNTSCNCGLMAQICLNKSASEVKQGWKDMKTYNEYADERAKKGDFSPGAWTNATNYYCGITGKPVDNIIGDLMKKGFTSLDISGLEYLSDNYILAKTDIKYEQEYYGKKENLIKYVDAWIAIIREQEQESEGQ